jgi:hypothetical protein
MILSLALLKVAMIPFADGVKSSDLIVVGRVSNIVNVKGHRFADVDVERRLKGNAGSTVRFLAEPTWTCDSTNAKVGEHGVFLLVRLNEDSPFIRGNTDLRDAIAASSEGVVYGVDHSGSGKILFENGGVRARNGFDGDYGVNMYSLPKGLRPGRSSRDGGRFTKDKFVATIEAMVARKNPEIRKR